MYLVPDQGRCSASQATVQTVPSPRRCPDRVLAAREIGDEETSPASPRHADADLGIPFELIDEYPIRSLGKLLEEAERHGIKLSEIHLVCRVDDINAHASDLAEILSLARSQDVKIMFASIGFESFSDRLLQYFCKGITVADIVKWVETLRRLKDQFGSHFLYRRDEGANHGFIRPTPWDESETIMDMDRNIFLYRFFEDILPEHSTPLIIHHASDLGDWIRCPAGDEPGYTHPGEG